MFVCFVFIIYKEIEKKQKKNIVFKYTNTDIYNQYTLIINILYHIVIILFPI